MGPLELLYYAGYKIKKNIALKSQKRLPHKVISIGNITVGGTGKTPATVAIAEEAKKRGHNPCILTRGYKGSAKGPLIIPPNPPLVKGGRGDLFHAVELYGDEPVLMAGRLQDVPIVKCADRYKGGLFALNSSLPGLAPRSGAGITHNSPASLREAGQASFVFILDDGFQHWRLYRDKDIVLIDGMNPFGNKRLLPTGLLRESVSNINRADIIVITKTSDDQQSALNSLVKELRQYNSKAPIFFARHQPLKFITSSGETMPFEWAHGKKLFAFSGIGNPESFRKTLNTAGIELTGIRTYSDHYRYNKYDLESIIKDSKMNGSEWIVTTEKDIIRIRGLDIPENLIALVIEFSVDKGFYEEVFN